MATTPKSETPHLGTRWVRAALQVNPYSYIGAGSPSSKFKDEPSYNSALLDKCADEDIGLIAVTDHGSVDGSQQLIAEAGERGIVALPGFEANASEGIHLVCDIHTVEEAGDFYTAFYPGEALTDRAWRMVAAILKAGPLAEPDPPKPIDL